MPHVTSAHFLFFFVSTDKRAIVLKKMNPSEILAQRKYRIKPQTHRRRKESILQSKPANTNAVNYSYNDISARIFLNDVECSYNPRIIMRKIITFWQVSHY